MMKKTVIDVLKKILETNNINEKTSQSNTTEWDSLKHLNLVVELESEFNVEFEPEEIVEIKSFKDIIGILNNKGIK